MDQRLNGRDEMDAAARVRRLAARFRLGAGQVHMVGICGVGMAGVARLLHARGWRVSGCDAAPAGATSAGLEAAGIAVLSGHDPRHAHLPDLHLVIRTAAVPDALPELCAARARGVPVVSRGQALAALARLRASVAVCGTHGKTTCAVVLTRLLQALGQAPGWCIGGTGEGLDGAASPGEGGWLVLEADESDGTLALYRPRVALVTNIEFDHAEHFADLAAVEQSFRRLVAATRDAVVYCADDAVAGRVCAPVPGALGYGLGAQAVLRAVDVVPEGAGSRFRVAWRSGTLGDAVIEVPGLHNVRNALGVLAAAMACGCDPVLALRALPRVYRLPARRFECRAEGHGVRLITDYAHHPTEVAALMDMFGGSQARVQVIFQPHRYSRTRVLGALFPPAFCGAEAIWLTPVYPASEAPVEGGTAADLHARFRSAGFASVHLCASPEEAWAGVRRQLRRGDRLLLVGAGDIVDLAARAAPAIAGGDFGASVALTGPAGFQGRLQADVPLGVLTGLGVGGACDRLAEPRDAEDLRLLLCWAHENGLPVRIMGRGANLLISDDGVDGVVIRLRGDAWETFRADGVEVRAGAGLSGARLLGRLERLGLGGLEFMDGIPGTLGGWLAMNAGAHGQAVGARVVAIEYLTPEGERAMLSSSQCGWGYRCCAGLRQRIALGAWLRLDCATASAVRERRAVYRSRRLSLGRLRTAGSVFRNPARAPAGKLLDEAGCKTFRVGGARVHASHANVIVAEAGALASDVRALMEKMRMRVRMCFDVDLEAEIGLWLRS